MGPRLHELKNGDKWIKWFKYIWIYLIAEDHKQQEVISIGLTSLIPYRKYTSYFYIYLNSYIKCFSNISNKCLFYIRLHNALIIEIIDNLTDRIESNIFLQDCFWCNLDCTTKQYTTPFHMVFVSAHPSLNMQLRYVTVSWYLNLVPPLKTQNEHFLTWSGGTVWSRFLLICLVKSLVFVLAQFL